MRVAMIAPLVAAIAPPYLGGAQALLRDLAAGLAARGHAVTLYAADGSEAPGARCVELGIDAETLRLVRFDAQRTAADGPDTPDTAFFTQAHHFLRIALDIVRHADAYDLVHAHAFDWPVFVFGALLPLPVLHTLHLPALDRPIAAALATLAAGGATNTRLAAVSHACAATYAPNLAIDTIIYNGIALDAIPFGAAPASEPYLLFAGRIAPEKGVTDALAIALQAGRRLLLAGDIYDGTYFAEHVRPALAELERAGQAEYLGPLPRERLWQLMAGAEAVLCPVQWEEPFGLVACESQAAGAPVVAYARGALPEVVADGETGWLVTPGDVGAAAAAVARVGMLSRGACRARVAERFGLDAMLAAYQRAYGEMVERCP